MNIKELQERYSLKTRQSIYDWCKTANITLAKDSNGRSTVTAEQIALLDELHEYLKQPGAIRANFTPVTPVSIAGLDSSIDKLVDNRIDISADNQDLSVYQLLDNVCREIGTGLASIVEAVTTKDPVHYMTVLERAAVSNWILSTNEVKQLIGVKPSLSQGKRVFTRGCWLFTRCGRIGNQVGWKVMKQIKN